MEKQSFVSLGAFFTETENEFVERLLVLIYELIERKDGTALYLTRDISEMVHRDEKYKFDHMIYVVASQQDLHLQQLFKIIKLMGYEELHKKVQHINFGLVEGMSTRRGTGTSSICSCSRLSLHEISQMRGSLLQSNFSIWTRIEPSNYCRILY